MQIQNIHQLLHAYVMMHNDKLVCFSDISPWYYYFADKIKFVCI